METVQPFVIERTYDAPVEKVWKAITDKRQMKEWYFDLEEFKAEVGFEFTFAGKGHKGEPYIHRCRVLEVIPQKKLTHTWTYENYPGYSTVTFELFSEGAQTRVKLTHAGLESFPPNNPDFAKESFAGGWTELIGKLLQQYVEK
jgi:uncharacterized protein YndB with AHSA1/START domain